MWDADDEDELKPASSDTTTTTKACLKCHISKKMNVRFAYCPECYKKLPLCIVCTFRKTHTKSRRCNICLDLAAGGHMSALTSTQKSSLTYKQPQLNRIPASVTLPPIYPYSPPTLPFMPQTGPNSFLQSSSPHQQLQHQQLQHHQLHHASIESRCPCSQFFFQSLINDNRTHCACHLCVLRTMNSFKQIEVKQALPPMQHLKKKVFPVYRKKKDFEKTIAAPKKKAIEKKPECKQTEESSQTIEKNKQEVTELTTSTTSNTSVDGVETSTHRLTVQNNPGANIEPNEEDKEIIYYRHTTNEYPSMCVCTGGVPHVFGSEECVVAMSSSDEQQQQLLLVPTNYGSEFVAHYAPPQYAPPYYMPSNSSAFQPYNSAVYPDLRENTDPSFFY